jgi:hypothetical protein
VSGKQPPINRRVFLGVLSGGALAALPACGPNETPAEGLIRLLELDESQHAWLSALTPPDQEELFRAFLGGEASARSAALLARVVGSRSRLLEFVGYGRVADRNTLCDGLFRE